MKIDIHRTTISPTITFTSKEKYVIEDKLPRWLKANGYDETRGLDVMVLAELSRDQMPPSLQVSCGRARHSLVAILQVNPSNPSIFCDSLTRPLVALEIAIENCLRELERF